MKSPDWLRILTASPRQRLPGGVQLRLLTAQEVLEARREATALAGEDRDRALCSNACLVARRWMAFYQEEGLGTGLERSRLDQLKKAWSTCRGSAFGGMCSNALGRCRRRNGPRR